MATYSEMIVDVRLATASRIDVPTIETLINRAHKQILELYPWSFLLTNAVINGATPKTAGLITVGQGNAIVQGAGCAFGQEDVGAFLWIGNTGITPLPIQSVQGTNTLTLAYPWVGPTLIGSGYVIDPLYYLVEGALEIYSVRANGIELTPRTREYINDIDPTRDAIGALPCTDWCPAPPSPDGSVMVELWPPSGGPMAYLVDFKRFAPQLVEQLDRPLCPYQIVEEKAMEMACLQMLANTAQSQWLELADRHRDAFLVGLDDAKAEDSRRVKDRNGVFAAEGWPGNNADFLPQHDFGR